MRYEIVIKKTCVETTIIPRRWDKDAGDNPSSSSGNWGYTPEVETREAVERDIFRQVTDNIDLVAVIMAINGMKDRQ